MGYPSFNTGDILTASDMNAVGLWRVTTCTVTSAGGTAATASNGVITIGAGNTSVTISNAFSADWTNYLIQISGGTAPALDWLNLTFSGSTGNTYAWQAFGQLWGTGGASTSTTNTNVIRIGTHDTLNYAITANVISPFQALQKYVYSQGASNQYYSTCAGRDTSAVSRTGFVLTPTGAGNTLTGGTVRVYGYRS